MRTETLRIGPVALQFPVCGCIEVRDGLVVSWRDHYDNVTVLLQFLEALVLAPFRLFGRSRLAI